MGSTNFLNFRYLEAPAEFQKQIIQIMDKLIRKDKILVYIDDILITSESIEQNLAVLREVLILLKQHKLELNLNKCVFFLRFD